MDTFYTQTTCDRCGKNLGRVRTMSWFTEDCICTECHKKETELKLELRNRGVNTNDLEDCGYVPQLDGE